ncbi:hypothetical protein [Chryseobacterium luteum]|uniref:Uncharacterized protein n=1 Tax=Chryseobacterium luteum TaxID=421531 RepID=A0A085ZC69_9FLAO|nr:hypothetical protein [Chryseobacterium luteum]KFF02033.1 hypothetical protein IX38_16205 [Chryseobacterium luteum]
MFNGIATGQNIFKSALIGFSGINYSFNLSSTDGINAGYKHYMMSNDYTEDKFGISGGSKDALSTVLNLLGINPSAPASMYSFSAMASVLVPKDAWIAVANKDTMDEWAKGYVKFNINKNDFLEYSNGFQKDVARGITNPVTGKMILAPALLNGKRTNFGLGSVMIHEVKHYTNWKNGILQGNDPLVNALNEISSYQFTAEWTGSMDSGIFEYLMTISLYYLNTLKYK